MDEFWLNQNTCIEPLISNWYAWTHLIAPMTAGLNIAKRYRKIYESYLEHPELHYLACKDPKLLGGPYINLPKSEIKNVQYMYNEFIARNKRLIQLSEEIDKLNCLLEESALGCSLEELYNLIPYELKGIIELVYDMHHRPSIRFIEGLVYNRFYCDKEQALLLSIIDADNRPFILSTPRFVSNEEILLQVPFRDDKLDILFQARRNPCRVSDLRDAFKINDKNFINFKKLFTSEKPKNIYNKYNQSGIRIRYFGHACILIETKSTSILVDPIISYSGRDINDRFSFVDLPTEIDYALITHAHQDHIDIETLLQLRPQIKSIVVPDNNQGFLADPSLKLVLKKLGFKSIVCLKEMETVKLKDGKITAIPFLGEHGDLNIQSKLAYCVNMLDKSFLFAVDSNNLDPELYKAISMCIPPINVLFIGMECEGAPFSWTYGSLFHKKIKKDFDKTRRLNGSNFEKTWQIIQIFQCKEVIIYAMGQEPWLGHIMGLAYSEDSIQLKEVNKLLIKCAEFGIHAEKPYKKKEWLYPEC